MQLIMKAINVIIYLITFCALLDGCAKKEISISEYIHYVEDPSNGLKVQKAMGKIIFSAQFKPNEYVAVKETKARYNSINEIEKNVKELKGSYYITFSIASSNNKTVPIEQSGTKEFDPRLLYCNSQMQNDFLLVDGKDTLPCSMYHFERNFGIAPFNNFLLGFDQKKSKCDDLTLIYFDKLFNCGFLKFRVNKSDIISIPKIKAF
jgi:hypothetical protein